MLPGLIRQDVLQTFQMCVKFGNFMLCGDGTPVFQCQSMSRPRSTRRRGRIIESKVVILYQCMHTQLNTITFHVHTCYTQCLMKTKRIQFTEFE